LNETKTGKLRGFEGGDIKGISKKIDEGYFDKRINAIWFTPLSNKYMMQLTKELD
jgi:alpha-amylase